MVSWMLAESSSKRIGKPSVAIGNVGAVEWIRTTTLLRAPAPQAGASASSATTAWKRGELRNCNRSAYFWGVELGAGVEDGGAGCTGICTGGAGEVFAGAGAVPAFEVSFKIEFTPLLPEVSERLNDSV